MAEAYRGYLICRNPILDEWWVEKGGAPIAWARDKAHARAIIDELVEGAA